jgi:DNA-binding transcriptional ArsR family regulator
MVLRNPLDRVFHALGDRTRRQMLKELKKGRRNITQLAHPFHMSYTAACKHVRVLEAAGLIRRKASGRSQELRIQPLALRSAYRWLLAYRDAWSEVERVLE